MKRMVCAALCLMLCLTMSVAAERPTVLFDTASGESEEMLAVMTAAPEALSVNVDSVNVKATTEEKLGFTGRLEGISAHCVALITK